MVLPQKLQLVVTTIKVKVDHTLTKSRENKLTVLACMFVTAGFILNLVGVSTPQWIVSSKFDNFSYGLFPDCLDSSENEVTNMTVAILCEDLEKEVAVVIVMQVLSFLGLGLTSVTMVICFLRLRYRFAGSDVIHRVKCLYSVGVLTGMGANFCVMMGVTMCSTLGGNMEMSGSQVLYGTFTFGQGAFLCYASVPLVFFGCLLDCCSVL